MGLACSVSLRRLGQARTALSSSHQAVCCCSGLWLLPAHRCSMVGLALRHRHHPCTRLDGVPSSKNYLLLSLGC